MRLYDPVTALSLGGTPLGESMKVEALEDDLLKQSAQMRR